MKDIVLHTQPDFDQWEKLLETSSTATFFQSKECYDFYCSLSFLEPFLIGVSEKNKLVGVVCGYIIADGGRIKRFFSRRAIIPGGALLDENISEKALTALLEKAIRIVKNKVIYIEFRNTADYFAYKEIFIKNNFQYQPYVNYLINTKQTKDKIWKNISDTKKKQIRRTIKAGVNIHITKEKKDIDEFYYILHAHYSKKIKKPLFPIDFFYNLLNLQHAYFFIAKKNEETIGGLVCVSIKNQIFHAWFISDCRELYPSLYTSALLTYTAIEYAVNNDFDYFDFMGAGRLDQTYGVRNFKEKFGGKLVENGRFIHIENSFLYRLGKLYIQKNKK